MNVTRTILLPGCGDCGRASAVLRSSATVARDVTLVEAVVRREDDWEDDAVPFLDRHIRARARGATPWPQLADVLAGPGGRRCSQEHALLELGQLRRQHPGALVTVLPYGDHRCAVRLGCGTVLLLAPPPGEPGRSLLPLPTVASILHAWLAAGVPPHALSSAVIETVRFSSPQGSASAAGGPRSRLLCCTLVGHDGSPSRSIPARNESGG